MSKTKKFIFTILHIVAWVIFIGLSIEAGGLIVNFIFSLVNPEFVGNLYQKLDLSKMYQQSKLVFFSTYFLLLSTSILKAVLFYIVIMLLIKLDLSKPFNSFVTKKILQISYYTFTIGILSQIAAQFVNNFAHYGYEIDKLIPFWADSQAFILMAAVIYIIAQIFKSGVELQNENDLTI